MRDTGFTPHRGKGPLEEIKERAARVHCARVGHRPVRWVMLMAPFTGGVSIFAFYAMQPYLLELWGNERAYAIAGLAAAIVAGAHCRWPAGAASQACVQPSHGCPALRDDRERRDDGPHRPCASVLGSDHAAFALGADVCRADACPSVVPQWLVQSEQRATVLSFDSLLGSSGAALIQPVLGKTADVWGYPVSYLASAAIQALALPFCWLAVRERTAADAMDEI